MNNANCTRFSLLNEYERFKMILSFFPPYPINTMKNLEIYLTRHGETEFNVTQRLQGWADSPLTEDGKRVAQELGDKLRGHDFQAAFCSTLPRTLTTAQLILAHQPHLPIMALNDLREYHFGQFEGDYGDDLYEKIIAHRGIANIPTWLNFYRHADYNVLAETVSQLDPRAETESQFVQRLQRGMAQVVANSPDEGRVLVVSHGMAIVALLKSIDKSAILYKSPANASVSRLHFDGTKWRILSVAQTDFV